MKLSEMRPCDNCGQPHRSPIFHVVRTSLAGLDANAARETLSLMNFFDGHLGLAEAMTPNPEAVKILGDENASMWTESIICGDCYLKPVCVAELQDKAQHRAEQHE